jgi:hypothetical protein
MTTMIGGARQAVSNVDPRMTASAPTRRRNESQNGRVPAQRRGQIQGCARCQAPNLSEVRARHWLLRRDQGSRNASNTNKIDR